MPEGADTVSRPSPDYPMLPTIPLSAFSDPKKNKPSHGSKDANKESGKASKPHKVAREHRERPRKDSESRSCSKEPEREPKSAKDAARKLPKEEKAPSWRACPLRVCPSLLPCPRPPARGQLPQTHRSPAPKSLRRVGQRGHGVHQAPHPVPPPSLTRRWPGTRAAKVTRGRWRVSQGRPSGLCRLRTQTLRMRPPSGQSRPSQAQLTPAPALTPALTPTLSRLRTTAKDPCAPWWRTYSLRGQMRMTHHQERRAPSRPTQAGSPGAWAVQSFRDQGVV